ncbi:PadR family transcriptional regulator [Nocardia australiensis]|uniref:PadR family transcriptional regulator n=1 Tax=Nocardia australiensis TaxID=2887191 RepID=UPI001D14A0C1|nr:PadR family transcriptional regulator [Nocardia australiensis]
MGRALRRTPATAAVLEQLAGTTTPVWGLQIVKDCGRPAGSVYPILARLEEAGWVTSEWETAQDHRGPRRRYYELTAEGRAQAGAMLASSAASPRATAHVRFA